MYCIRKIIKFSAHRLANLKIISQYKYAKDVSFGPDARSQILQGIDTLADAVELTIGPKGRFVILEQVFGPPKITKDGVTIAKGINFSDKLNNIGAKLMQNVAVKTKEDAGDGTSTATILARSIAKEGFENISKGANPIKIRSGINNAVKVATDELRKISKPINTLDEIEQIAIIAANGDHVIGQLISKAMDKVGKKGVVIVKHGKKISDEIEVIEGIKIERGYVSPCFTNSHKGCRVKYSNALVLFSQIKIFYATQIIPALEAAIAQRRPLIIVAEDYEDEVLSVLTLNKLKAGLQVAAIKAPGFGEYRRDTLFDLATLTGGIVFEDKTNLIRLEDCQPESFGRVGEVSITKDSTLFLKGEGDRDEIEQRIEEINTDLLKTTADYEKKKLLDRLSRLKSKVAVIYVGATSEVELVAKKDYVNDALNATYAGIEEGVVPGGGTALLRCIPALSKLEALHMDEAVGINIVKDALRAPCIAIMNNAGLDGKLIASRIEGMTGNYGYDIFSNEYINMTDKGIVDPTKVIIKALAGAASVGTLLTTAEAVIYDLCVKNQKQN